ncbi:carbohydrate ABC transporter substrate-binding protein (CUT1 family) [Halanaerobium saccharolyticum]|uniref:Carbohydrate ABC transporter substrate-binding protein (CUT1 family) n=1 Tax=Halanaerobium saccharolyticum TaxID=43595 RepID=A0A4R6L8N9_9FIRM|nr:extracellular solute-binding protein [Halanaerobium saccharolyticum]TDO70036.1 carbohydrate ABC transporter substrate-binding protein (CUT1 family) [Halanaerobium saccharolyticum]
MHKKRRLLFIILIIGMFVITGCSRQNDEENNDGKITIEDNILKGSNFENLKIPKNYNIKQFEGTTLNFIVEKNINANILSHESESFSELTGINIKIRAMDYDSLIQNANLDLLSQSGEYQIIYVDPYQTTNRYHTHLVELNSLMNNQELPEINGFPDDFFEFQTKVTSNYKDQNKYYAVPFDSTTMILYYRKDIFEKYHDQFYQEKGYDWTPGSKEFTWERYSEVAEWIDKNVPDSEVKYGSGQMGQEHNSIFCEFSTILDSYGGSYFNNSAVNTYGIDSFKNFDISGPNFIKALDVYKKVVSTAAPESVNWNWTNTANAFRDGQIAMMPNWDENSTYVENNDSKVKGKVAYSILPYGSEKSANIYGGSGIAINKHISEKEKEAAWLYIVWATSKEMQLKILKHPEGGSLPTRKSVYNDIKIKQFIEEQEDDLNNNIAYHHLEAVLNAWKEENLYLRPKLKDFYQFEKVLIENLHQMLVKNLDSRQVRDNIRNQLRQIN